MAVFRRIAAVSALAAAASMSASAVAAELPHASVPAAAYVGEKAQGHGYPYRYRRNRVDAGDVLAGVLILGTIAAVAGAAKSNRDRDYRYPNQRPPYPRDSQRYDDRRSGDEDSRGIDRAVGMCVDEVERGNSGVDEVDGANRTGEGWEVRGRMENGAPFTCRIGTDGRIRDVEVGPGRAEVTPADDHQYSADVYARARASAPGTAAPGTAPTGGVDNRPVWTGDRVQAPAGNNGADDGRYGVSATPDFEQVG